MRYVVHLFRDARPTISRLAKFYYGWRNLASAYHPSYWVRFRRPRMVLITGMPRSGTTLAKRYLGEHPRLKIAPAGFHRDGWAFAMAAPKSQIAVFKNTRNMVILPEIYSAYGNRVWFLGVVRDPRDSLASLVEAGLHAEIPRNGQYWSTWTERYEKFFDFALHCSRRGSKVAFMRYEDLVLRPVTTKVAFLTWLRLPTNEVTPYYRHTIPDIASKRDTSEDWKTHQHNEVHSASLGRWRREGASEEFLKSLEDSRLSQAIELMRRLGYGEETSEPTLQAEGIHFLR